MASTRGPRKRGSSTDDSHAREGCAERGEEFNPADRPAGDDSRTRHPRPAPAPGVPISSEKYKRLKDQARHRRERVDVPAQEDAPAPKKK